MVEMGSNTVALVGTFTVLSTVYFGDSVEEASRRLRGLCPAHTFTCCRHSSEVRQPRETLAALAGDLQKNLAYELGSLVT